MTEPPQLHAIGSRAEFVAAVRDAIVHAADTGAASMVFVDPDFDGWPLGDAAVVDELTRWAKASRTLTLVGGDFTALARRAPRFVEWRRQWSHAVACRAPEDIEPDQMPTLLLVAGLVTVRLADRIHHRGTVSAKPIDEVAARETVDALLQRSVETFPATTLGL